MAANIMWLSKSSLGGYFRRKQAQGRPSKAILATAGKMATYIYLMIKGKTPFQPERLEQNQSRWKEIRTRKLEAQLNRLKAAA
jgi:hypothetical protein